MKISEHIYFYPAPESKSLIKSCNTIVIVGNGNQVIIDPGVNLKKKWKKLLDGMRKNGLDIKNTTEIWLTHHHPDHTQLVRKIVKLSGAKVYCHPLAKKILEAKGSQLMFEPFQAKSGGKFKLSGVDFYLKGFSPRQALEVFNLIKILGIKKVKVDKVFHDKDKATINSLDIYIISLPGHCPTELGFWIPKEKVLIIGDLIHPIKNGQGGRSHFPVLNTFYPILTKPKNPWEK